MISRSLCGILFSLPFSFSHSWSSISFLGIHLPVGKLSKNWNPWKSIFAKESANLWGEPDRKCVHLVRTDIPENVNSPFPLQLAQDWPLWHNEGSFRFSLSHSWTSSRSLAPPHSAILAPSCQKFCFLSSSCSPPDLKECEREWQTHLLIISFPPWTCLVLHPCAEYFLLLTWQEQASGVQLLFDILSLFFPVKTLSPKSNWQ